MKQKHFGKWILSHRIVVILLSILVVGGTIWAGVAIIQKKSEPTPPEVVTVEGTFDCLPRKDTSRPHTLECALGIKTDDNIYYALKFEKDPSMASSVVTGQRAKISGLFQKQESVYKSEGSISVDSLTKQ